MKFDQLKVKHQLTIRKDVEARLSDSNGWFLCLNKNVDWLDY